MIAMPTVDPETELLIAMRDHLRQQCGFDDKTCDVELDEYVPPTQGHSYIVVCPDGWNPGRDHAPAGHTEHINYSVEIIVCQKVGNVAKDRLRNKFTREAGALNKQVLQIIRAIGNGYAVSNAANVALEAGGDEGRFIEPPEFKSCDKRPRQIGGGSVGLSESVSVLARSIRFQADYYRKF